MCISSTSMCTVIIDSMINDSNCASNSSGVRIIISIIINCAIRFRVTGIISIISTIGIRAYHQYICRYHCYVASLIHAVWIAGGVASGRGLRVLPPQFDSLKSLRVVPQVEAIRVGLPPGFKGPLAKLMFKPVHGTYIDTRVRIHTRTVLRWHTPIVHTLIRHGIHIHTWHVHGTCIE